MWPQKEGQNNCCVAATIVAVANGNTATASAAADAVADGILYFVADGSP